jgi:type IX secretion system PorP/SprF family membrane protein
LPPGQPLVSSPLAINPGFSGISGRINMVAIDRHQWMGLEGAPNTTVVGADMALNIFGNPSGVGIVISNDRIGFFRDLNIQGSVSQKYELGEGLLGVGLSLGLINQVVDGTKFISNPDIGNSYYHQERDDLVPDTEVNGTTFDAGVGLYYKHEKYYGGLSVMHLFEPKPNFDQDFTVYIPRSFFLTVGYNYKMWERPLVIKPSFMIKGVGPIWQYDLNVSVVYLDKMWGGLSYRYQDAIVVMGGVELASGLKVGYSYDITTSRLAKVSNGSHEIMIGYTFDLSLEKRVKQYKSVRFL